MLKHFVYFFFAFFFLCASGQAQTPDPLGSITSTSIFCPKGKTPGSNSCYELAVSNCPTAAVNAYIKVTQPAEGLTPIGLIVFASGGPGTEMYEDFAYGMTVIGGALDLGYVAVQLSYGGPFTSSQPNGWITGPNGPRAAACNYATAVEWIYTNLVLNIPLCITGNSDGATMGGYALTHFGLGPEIAFAELSSGPSYSNLDSACYGASKAQTPCGEGVQGYNVAVPNAEDFIDPTYASTPTASGPGPICSQANLMHTNINEPTFLDDSILSDDGTALLQYPTTNLNIVLGGEDHSAVPNQANLYFSAITSSKNLACVPDANHELPSSQAGAAQILADLTASCHY